MLREDDELTEYKEDVIHVNPALICPKCGGKALGAYDLVFLPREEGIYEIDPGDEICAVVMRCGACGWESWVSCAEFTFNDGSSVVYR